MRACSDENIEVWCVLSFDAVPHLVQYHTAVQYSTNGMVWYRIFYFKKKLNITLATTTTATATATKGKGDCHHQTPAESNI